MTPLAYIPSTEQIMAFCPEVFELCMEVGEITLAGTTDLDRECFEACETLLIGGAFGAALEHISLEHPKAEEAIALITAAYVRHYGHNPHN